MPSPTPSRPVATRSSSVLRASMVYLARATLLASLLLSMPACSGGDTREDKKITSDKPAKKKVLKSAAANKNGDPLEMGAPSSEELAKSPCGNPNWTRLPEAMVNDPNRAKDGAASEEKSEDKSDDGAGAKDGEEAKGTDAGSGS